MCVCLTDIVVFYVQVALLDASARDEKHQSLVLLTESSSPREQILSDRDL